MTAFALGILLGFVVGIVAAVVHLDRHNRLVPRGYRVQVGSDGKLARWLIRDQE